MKSRKAVTPLLRALSIPNVFSGLSKRGWRTRSALKLANELSEIPTFVGDIRLPFLTCTDRRT